MHDRMLFSANDDNYTLAETIKDINSLREFSLQLVKFLKHFSLSRLRPNQAIMVEDACLQKDTLTCEKRATKKNSTNFYSGQKPRHSLTKNIRENKKTFHRIFNRDSLRPKPNAKLQASSNLANAVYFDNSKRSSLRASASGTDAEVELTTFTAVDVDDETSTERQMRNGRRLCHKDNPHGTSMCDQHLDELSENSDNDICSSVNEFGCIAHHSQLPPKRLSCRIDRDLHERLANYLHLGLRMQLICPCGLR